MTKIEDRELATWREQWQSAAEPLPHIHKRIKRQNFWFLANNLASLCAAIAALIFVAWAVHREPSQLRIGWAAGLCVLLFVAVGYRLWLQRGTWRAEAQSTRAFVELWQRRVRARVRTIRLGFYLIPAWIIFCGGLATANWATIGPDVHAHPRDWAVTLTIIAVMVAASFLWLAWYRRRKLRELAETERILDQMKD